MINSYLKRAVAVAVLAGVSAGANADTTTDLGTIPTGDQPTIFNGTVLGSQQSFSDLFTFSLSEPNVSSGYSVVNVPLEVSNFSFDTVLATMSLVSAGANGVIGGGDDVLLASTVVPGGDSLSLEYNQPLTGPAYLNITGVADGSTGGIYAGAIAGVVPEPETYAMLLAGLGLMGAVVRRRSRKTS